MTIDSHTHVLNEKILEQYKNKSSADVLICIKFYKGFCGGAFDNRDEGIYEFIEKYHNLLLVESIDFEMNVLNQLEELKEKMKATKKIRGIKLYPGYQHFYPYNERVLPAYVFANENNIPVILHSGALYQYENSEALLQYVNPIYVDEAATRYPETKFVITHFGFPYLQETAMVLNKNNNVYADISGLLDENTYEVFRDDFKRVLKYYSGIEDQILFGTDFVGNDTYLNEVDMYVKLVEEIFDEPTREKIFYRNAQRVFNIKFK